MRRLRHRLLTRSISAFIAGSTLPVLLLLSCARASADTTLELKDEFIEANKNRATIESSYSIKFAHPKPKTPSPSKPSNDGDIHISGTAPEIGLLTVAEIMNAKDVPAVLKFVQDQKGGAPVRMVGVWRIWPEHGGESHHVQGGADPSEIMDTNPDHIFEIHPLTQVGTFDVKSTFHLIPNFKTKNAQDAFQNYEGARSKITPKADSIQIRLSQATYNYVEFRLELLETPSHELDDGLTAFARVRTLDGETIVQKRRMVFVKGTKPETNIRKLSAGQCMHALGMPRLDLTLVSWRVKCSKDQIDEFAPLKCSEKFPDVLDWGIPYEIVVLADYGGSRKCD
jgi:hypothetical protein